MNKSLPEIVYSSLTLANGLKVVIAPEPALPTVSVAVVYNVGSRCEEKGRSGFAHLFEHMMFQGSQNLPKQAHSRLIEERGGIDNGFTMRDFTAYYQTLPGEELGLALWLEADRMRSLAITQENFDNQKDVVEEEKRMRYDNQPYMNAIGEDFFELMFSNWANAHSTIGTFADLGAATIDDIRTFFARFYAPNNAVVVIVGGIDAAEAGSLVREHFSSIPPGPAALPVDLSEPQVNAPKTLTIEDRLAPQPAMLMGWHAPRRDSPDYLALAVLGSVLTEGDDSRLHQLLVKEKQWALSVDGGLGAPTGDYFCLKDPSQFTLIIHYKDVKDARAIQDAVTSELKNIAQGGIDQQEILRAQNKFMADMLDEMQSSENRACWLGIHTWMNAGDPKGFAASLNRFFDPLTPADLAAAAARHLSMMKRFTLDILPAPDKKANAQKKTLTPRPQAPPRQQAAMPVTAPKPGTLRKGRLEVTIEAMTLANGIKIHHVRDTRLPFLKWRMSWTAPQLKSSAGAHLAASTAATELLTSGTPTKNNTQIESLLASYGAEFSAGAGFDNLIACGSVLTPAMRDYFKLIHELLSACTYPQEEVTLWQHNAIAMLDYKRSRAGYLGAKQYAQELFGTHPYATIDVLPAEIMSLERGMLTDHLTSYLTGAPATLVSVGSADIEELAGLFSDTLATLPRALERRGGASQDLTQRAGRRVVVAHRPGCEQSNIIWGHLSITRKHKDYYPMSMANAILGQAFTSRLIENIRERKGYTYSIHSQLDCRPKAGVFSVMTPVRTEVTRATIEEIALELATIKDSGVTPTEYEMTTNYLCGLNAIRLSKQESLCERLFGASLLDIDLSEVLCYDQKISGVSSERVNAAAKQHILP
ncbi:MAG: pitrilysin family protein, partial [Elusimicrobiota bacterium]